MRTSRCANENHLADFTAIDFFIVPTATFRVLYVLLTMSHDRRRILHFNVTISPSAHWTAQQVAEAFPYAQGQEPSAASGSKVPSANRTGGWATGPPRLPLGPDDGLAHRAGRYPSSDAWPR